MLLNWQKISRVESFAISLIFSSIAKLNPRKIVLPISGAKYQSKITKYVTKIRKQAQNFLHLGKFIPTKPNFCPTRSRKFIPVKLSTFTVLSVSENIGLPTWNVNKIHLLVTHLLSYVNGDNRYLTNDAILITIFEQVEPGKAGKQKISGKWLENTPKI